MGHVPNVLVITLGSNPPPLKSFFWQLDQFLSTFGKKCIFPFENPKTLRKISKNWCWKCKMSCKLLQMLVIPHKMTARPRKMAAAPRKMTAATHLMFAKDQRGGLRSPQGPRGPTPLPLYLKKLLCLEMIFRAL